MRHAHVSNVYGDWTGNDERSEACNTCPGACPGTCCQVRTPLRGSHFALLPAGPWASVTSPACPARIIRGPGHSGTLIFAHRAFSGTARRGTLIPLLTCTASLYGFFMWQDDIIGVARFTHTCLAVGTSAGPPMGTRHLISPELAGKGVMILLPCCKSVLLWRLGAAHASMVGY